MILMVDSSLLCCYRILLWLRFFFCGLHDAVLVDSMINCCRASFADFRDLLFAPSYSRVRACYCIPVLEGFIRSLR